MKISNRLKWRLWLALVVIAISGLFVGLRRTSGFAAAVELPLYDLLTVKIWPWEAEAHPSIIIVTMSDEGFWRGMNDAGLATLLDRIESVGPSVISVDLIRDNPLPPGSERLRDLVLKGSYGEPMILMSSGMPGSPGKEGFEPPPFLRGADQIVTHVGLALMPEDLFGRPMVRRGLVAIHGGEMLSMPAQAAVCHLTFKNPDRLESVYERLTEISALSATAGGYVGNTGGGNQFLLKPEPNLNSRYPVVAAEEVAMMSGEELQVAFTGKVVFVGTEGNLVQDEKPVAGNPSLRGVKLLAFATDQLLRELEGGEASVGWVPDYLEDLAVFASVGLCCLACSCLGGGLLFRIFTIVPILSVAWIGLGGWGLANSVWFPVGAPIAATLLAGVSTYSLMFLRERNERQDIYALLEKHLSPEVAGAVWEHNEELLKDQGPPPELIQATALFADLKGYSGITEDFQKGSRNREFINWLNVYLQAVIPLIRSENGFVQQFAGDGIFVIFGFPHSKSDAHPLRAVRCARAIAGVVADLNKGLEAGLPAYHARIGIYTGEIICATVGDQSHASYSFFGSTINKAARLESLQKHVHDVEYEPVRILISDATRRAVRESVPTMPFAEQVVQLDPNLPSEKVWKVF